ncbi:MAG: NADH-quinone oxidoreductase subunit J [Dehalococcoidia bacterium]|jgi:NADH-quinone oxidoreductase subunit J
MALSVSFWILAVIAVMAALAVVMLNNVFRSALSLVLCFLVVAGIYLTLSADFLAVVQILVYVGAISVLIMLAIMLTREVQRGSTSNRFRVPAFIVAALVLGGLIYSMVNTNWQTSAAAPVEPTTPAIANLLFGEGGFILPLEIAPILLVAAIIGAIVLVREK